LEKLVGYKNSWIGVSGGGGGGGGGGGEGGSREILAE